MVYLKMPMVGIPLEILYTMLVIAFAAPVFFIGANYGFQDPQKHTSKPRP